MFEHAWEDHATLDETEDVEPQGGELEEEGLEFGDLEDAELAEGSGRISPPGYHTVSQGETLASIAESYGFFGHVKIWQAAENGELRDTRDPGVLLPGDRLFIPARVTKQVAGRTCAKRP